MTPYINKQKYTDNQDLQCIEKAHPSSTQSSSQDARGAGPLQLTSQLE